MSAGKKIAISLFISVISFSLFVLIAYTSLFPAIEARFYQPRVLASYEKKLQALSESFESYLESQKRFAFSFASDPSIRKTSSPNQERSDIEHIEKTIGRLLSEANGFLGLRVIGLDGKKIHYSSFSQDVFKKEASHIQYETYEKLSELDYQSIFSEKEQDYRIYFDSVFDRIVLSLPFFDSFNIYQGSIVFYYSVAALEQIFISESLMPLTESLSVSDKGLVFGLTAKGQKELKEELKTALEEDSPKLYPQFTVNDSVFLFLSYDFEYENYRIIFSQLLKEELVLFNHTIKIVLLVSFFITVFLSLLFLLSLKSDASLIIRQRIKKFQFALLNEYLETKEKINWNDVIASIESRKIEVALSLKKSLGKKAKKHQELVDGLLEKSWDEIMGSLNRSKTEFVQNVQVDTSEIRSMLEEILLSTRQSADGFSAPIQQKVAVDSNELRELDEVEEIADLSDAGELDELAELSDADELDELAELSDVDELDELTELSDIDDVEEIAELDDLDELDEPSSEFVDLEFFDDDEKTPGENIRELLAEELTFGDIEITSFQKVEAKQEIDPMFTLDIAGPDFSSLDRIQDEELDTSDEEDYKELDASDLVHYIDDNAAFSFAIQFNAQQRPETLESSDVNTSEDKEPIKETIIEDNGLFIVNKNIDIEDLEIDSEFINLIDSVTK